VSRHSGNNGKRMGDDARLQRIIDGKDIQITDSS
jgi:hypothetical protein